MTTTTPLSPNASASPGLWTAITLGRSVERQGTRDSRLPGFLAITAFAVATAALLITLAGVHAFSERHAAHPDDPTQGIYLSLAFAASGMLIAPILTLGGVAARLTLGRRDQRLAAMRLVGATRSQISAITLAETGWLAVRGAVCGIALYAVAIPALRLLHFQGRAFDTFELVVPWWWLPAVVCGVALLALVSGLVSLRRVAISPLGVSARHTPKPMRLVRVIVTVAALAVWLVIGQSASQFGAAMLLVVIAGLIAIFNVVGPFTMMLVGRILAAAARGPRTLVAARRLVDDPRAAWRAVGSLGLGITVAGMAGTAAGMASGDQEAMQLSVDMRTGAFVTLGIIAVIAATSTGVVLAARIIDQRAELRMLALAGGRQRDLVVAMRREVTYPLALTVVMACGFCALIIAPAAASSLGAGTVLWLVGAIGGSVALMLIAVRSTKPLVRDALRAG